MKASFLKVDAFVQSPEIVEQRLSSCGDLALRLFAIRKDAARTPIGGANLISIEVGVREKTFRGRFDVFAEPGEIAPHFICRYSPNGSTESIAITSGEVFRKCPLRAVGGPETFSLLKNWVQECLLNHDPCRRALNMDLVDDNQPILPRRVIDVGSTSRPPRLVETNQSKEIQSVSRYVTLSHCWGPPNKRPLRTTKATLHLHLREICLQNMPKTFRDAISICRNLDIPYLWIDSLCIIQDNEEDWQLQSAVMGSIYERAFFTISASSAEDSSQGLFMERFPLGGVEIPYNSASGNQLCSVVAYLRQDLQSTLSSSPLNRRAWVVQEYFLSRRMLHFTQNGILWSCKNSKNTQQRWFQSEYGDDWVVLHDFPVWKWLVTTYSRREITFKSDKLIALQGLAAEFGKKNKNTYAYGLWLEELPEDLFWHGERKLKRDIGNNIPSWSWASTSGEIYFKSFDEPQWFCGAISLDVVKHGQLVVTGLIKKVDTLRGPLACQAFSVENLQRMDFTGSLHDEYNDNNLQVAPTYLFLSGDEKVGWCVFDEFDRPLGTVWCLPLLKQHVWAWYASAEEYFYWILVLQSCLDGTYVRVGWGLVLRTSWFEDVAEQRINLT